MSLQWTIVASFLYGEVAFITLLILPIVSPTRWKRIFKWVQGCKWAKKLNYYFYFFISGLVVLILDAIREVIKYEPALEEISAASFMNNQIATEFRAQRNLYITGTTLFLAFVINRLIKLITHSADLMEQVEILKKGSDSFHSGKLSKEDEKNFEAEENSARKRNVKKD